jgi:fructose-1,6-bisphosphatase
LALVTKVGLADAVVCVSDRPLPVQSVAVPTGSWFAIQALEDTTFSAVSSDITSLPNGLVLAAGTIIYGNFTAFTLASGKVIAYAK